MLHGGILSSHILDLRLFCYILFQNNTMPDCSAYYEPTEQPSHFPKQHSKVGEWNCTGFKSLSNSLELVRRRNYPHAKMYACFTKWKSRWLLLPVVYILTWGSLMSNFKNTFNNHSILTVRRTPLQDISKNGTLYMRYIP